MTRAPTPLDLLDRLLACAKRAGADSADAVFFESASLEVAQRLGRSEKLERAESRDLGLRAFVGRKQAIVSSTDLAADTFPALAERCVAMARVAPDDPYAGLADSGQLAGAVPALDICDPQEPSADLLIDKAARAEDAARAIPKITNSEGAEAGWSRSVVALAATNGFARSYESSSHSLAVSVLAGDGADMERDYDYATAAHGTDLPPPEEIGRRAGERAARRLGARKIETAQVPVVYDRRVSGGLVGHFAGAVNGVSISRGTSFLKESMGARVFGEAVTILDDPHRRRGLRSKPFDAEGIANARRALVENGRLASWVLDLGSARQLGLETTGNAARGTASPPSPATTNLFMQAGEVTREDLIGDVRSGFYVVELIGMGVSVVTGDYSRGATGFWIENGEIAYPVSELTIAGNLKDMFANLTPADDLEFRYGVDAPTVRVDGMTVAGR